MDIAVIITEKVYKYSSRDSRFLAKYDFLVLDELGLLDNPNRGIRLDFILAQAKRQRATEGRTQIIALGTPFYDWSAYIENYQFHFYTHDKRPVDLLEFPVFYNPKYGVTRVMPDNPCLYQVRLMTLSHHSNVKSCGDALQTRCTEQDCLCRADEPYRHDREKTCSRPAGRFSQLQFDDLFVEHHKFLFYDHVFMVVSENPVFKLASLAYLIEELRQAVPLIKSAAECILL